MIKGPCTMSASNYQKIQIIAIDGRAALIVTGDGHLLKLENYEDIKIITENPGKKAGLKAPPMFNVPKSSSWLNLIL